MVWGMALPKGFGEFWPEGVFERDKWYDRLRAHYRQQSSEEQKRLFDYKGEGASHYYGTFPSYKLTSEPGSLAGGKDRPPCGPMQPHEPPRTFDVEKRYKDLGSLIMLNDKILAVDEQLKHIIERQENNKHEFFEIDIIMPKAIKFARKYYTVLIGQYFDSFLPEKSDPSSFREVRQDFYYYDETKKGMNGLAFSKAKFGDAHLWRERRFRENLTCFSDVLQAEVVKAGLSIPPHYRMKEV